MSMDESQLAALGDVCDEVRVVTDGQYTLVLLTALRFRSDGQTVTMDALLCPQEHESYMTRLFLERALPSKGANWKPHSFLGRTWHTFSWQNVPKDLSLNEILFGHLDALA